MENKELVVGTMKWNELAEWFEVKYGTLRNNKQKYLDKLSLYAEWHINGKNKLVIDKVIEPKYSKAKEQVDAKFDQYWHTDIDTCSRAGSAIWRDDIKISRQIGVDTCIKYTADSRTVRYGRPAGGIPGTKGICKRIWAKYLEDEDKYRALNQEELEILDSCLKVAGIRENTAEKALYYDGNPDSLDKYNMEELKSLIVQMNQEITPSKYKVFLKLAKQKLGFCPIRATKTQISII